MTTFDRYRDIAFSSPDTIRVVQEKLLREHLLYCAEHSPYYRRTLNDAGLNFRSLTLDQLSLLPFTEKRDIERFNDDFRAVPPSKIVDIVLSSGTTGAPTRIMYTNQDLHRLAYNEEKSFAACGMTAEDIVLLTCTMDRCFIAGLAYFLGMRNLGAAVIRNGLSSLDSQAEMIIRMKPTVIIGVPTFLRKLAYFMHEKGMDPASTAVSKLVCIGEPVREEKLGMLPIGDLLGDMWQAKVFSTYASSEIITSFCECIAQQGGHLHPDLAVVEIVDENGAVLSAGNVGEVVVTPMAVEGMPLVRFKTGDVSFLMDEPCSCGRFSIRLGPILGRRKQMMKVRGTTIYPQAVYSALEEIKAITDYYITVTSESDLSDKITIYASVNESSCTADAIQNKLQARLRVKPTVLLADEEMVRRRIYTPQSRKPVFFMDRRSVKL